MLTQLGIAEEGLIVAGFDRPNIRYIVRHRETALRQLAQVMAENPGPGIVYAPTRKKVEDLAEKLASATGRRVLPYHAGLDPQTRAANQAAFVASEDMVIADFVLGGAKFPAAASLGITFGLIAAGIGWSLWKTRGQGAASAAG